MVAKVEGMYTDVQGYVEGSGVNRGIAKRLVERIKAPENLCTEQGGIKLCGNTIFLFSGFTEFVRYNENMKTNVDSHVVSRTSKRQDGFLSRSL